MFRLALVIAIVIAFARPARAQPAQWADVPPPPPVPEEPLAPEPPSGETITIVDERPAGEAAKAPVVNASDHRIVVGKLGEAAPPKSATNLLQLAPGFLLTNEGGEGHAEQIFLRGFDAREGQDLELRVNGDVVNQAGNLHGNGYADLHFVIPELVEQIRVLEGPYDPRQGNFAVAGSAEYELGLPRRGLFASYDVGSFGTERALLLWGPPGESSHSFGGVELYQTDGFGENRDARRATALGQLEGHAGEHGVWRVTAGAYLTTYHSAGVVREDAGAGAFYDTTDFRQGGDAMRAFVLGALEHHHDGVTYRHQLSLTGQTMGLREDFTGFLLDQQEPFQQPHAQRGDLIDVDAAAITAQAQGFLRRGPIEAGYVARVDRTSGTEYRIAAATGHPYHQDTDLDATLGDIGLYLAADARPLPWLALRGGVRADLLAYDVVDHCAVHDIAHPIASNPPGDASCLAMEDYGKYREPIAHATAAGTAIAPRASILAGPFAHTTASLSYGEGFRSIDPSYISQDLETPFARIRSYEAGAQYDATPLSLKAAAFQTHVDRDLVFSETAGRSVIGGGTTRTGASVSARVTGDWFDELASATLVQSTFDDTGLLVPYVPDVVVRSDSAVFGALPWWDLRGLAGLGVTFIGPRALPYGERGDALLTIDASAQVSWQRYTAGIRASNLLDARYRLGEYNFASDFHTAAQPTLTIARQFTAGAPRTVLLHLEVAL